MLYLDYDDEDHGGGDDDKDAMEEQKPFNDTHKYIYMVNLI